MCRGGDRPEYSPLGLIAHGLRLCITSSVWPVATALGSDKLVAYVIAVTLDSQRLVILY